MTTRSDEPVRVLIADDDRLFRRLLSRLFSGIDGVEVVGEARDGAEAIEATARLNR